jgi:hypothetical protein
MHSQYGEFLLPFLLPSYIPLQILVDFVGAMDDN